VSATFHGRDLFAPVGRRAGRGASLEEAGDPLDADEVQTLHMPLAEIDADGLTRTRSPSTASATSRSTSSTRSSRRRAAHGPRVGVNDHQAVYA
jgi:hypothetical protein